MLLLIYHTRLIIALIALGLSFSSAYGNPEQHRDTEGLVARVHEESLRQRKKVLQGIVEKETCWPGGKWGDVLWSLSALYMGEKLDDANARLFKSAREYIVSSQNTKERGAEEQTPWTYFSLTDYVRILCLFHSNSQHLPGRLEPETESAMKEALWLWVKSESTVKGADLENLLVTLGTENHDLTLRPSYYLIASLLASDPEYQNRPYDDGHTAVEHAAAYTKFFQHWAGKRATTGLWIEIGSNGYQKYSWPGIFNLYELAPDPLVRKSFGRLLDLAFIEEAQISVRGRRGGGRSRANGGVGEFESYKNLLYVPEGEVASGSHSKVIETSSYQLPPEAILLRFKELPASKPFVIRNRVLGELDANYSRDREGEVFTPDSALVNYAYRTPHYLLGSTLQNPSLTLQTSEVDRKVESKYSGISRQNRWCGMLFDNPARKEVSAVYPVIEKTRAGRPQHPFWSVQHENVILLQRIIPQTQWHVGSYSTGVIGIRFDGEDLKSIEEDDWIFSSDGKAFIAVKFIDGAYQWSENRRVALPADFKLTYATRILMHAGDLSSHTSFDGFREEVHSNPLEVTPNRVEYQFGNKKSTIEFTLFAPKQPRDFKLPKVNNVSIDLHPDATWESPYLNGRFGSDEITVTVGTLNRVMDFSTKNVSD